MRISILSDIHSNYEALVSALALSQQLRADKVYCLGDIVGYGGNPNECVNLIRENVSYSVLGNHDLAIIDTSHARYLSRHGKATAEWTRGILTQNNLTYLENMPYLYESDLLTLVHSNPDSPNKWTYIASLEDARPQFTGFKTPLCFIGHTHVPFVCGEDLTTLFLKKGIRCIINVGSVGQPRDGNPQLSFGFLDTDAWTYQNMRADYDVESAARSIITNGLPRYLATRLFRGV